MATEERELPDGCDKEVFARISAPLDLEAIESCIRGALQATGDAEERAVAALIEAATEG